MFVRSLRVVRVGVVVAPFCGGELPDQAANRFVETLDQTLEGQSADLETPSALARMSHALLAPGVQEEMREERETKPRPGWQESAGEIEGHTVDLGAGKRAEPHVAIAHQSQRRQEVLTELAIGDPG